MNNYNDRIHRLGRITVIVSLISFILVPIVLGMYYDISYDAIEMITKAMPIILTFTVSAVCENVSYAPIIGPGALYMSCITGNISNMKMPAAMNAMEVVGCKPGTDKGHVISIISVASSTFMTTTIVFLGMIFLSPIFEPIYNNPIFKPAFDNLVPALFGAILAPYILKNKRESIVPIFMPVILILILGRKFYSANQSYLMIAVMLGSIACSYMLNKEKFVKNESEKQLRV